jgi:hypothetical protein
VDASAAEDAMQWYYTVQGQRQGPVDDAGLEDLVRQGVIRDDTYVWREGLAEWQLYGAMKPKSTPAPVAASLPRPIEQPPAGALGASPSARPYAAPSHAALPAAAKPAAADSKRFFFYYPVLRALGDGRVIRTCVVWGLKIGAVAVALGGLLSTFGILSAAQGSGGGAMLGAILLAVVVLATSLCVGQVCWYRSGSVAALGESDYTVIPIASILFRTAGECGATAFAGLGAGACLFLLLSPAGGIPGMDLRSLPLLIAMPASTGLVGGIAVLLYAGLLAFLSLIAGYLAAEWTAVLVDIAGSIHKIRRVAEKAE